VVGLTGRKSHAIYVQLATTCALTARYHHGYYSLITGLEEVVIHSSISQSGVLIRMGMERVQTEEGEELESVLNFLTYYRVTEFSSSCHQMKMIVLQSQCVEF